MKSANISICEEYGLLSQSKIDKIKAMPKARRERAIGMLELKDRIFMKNLESKFDEVVAEFIKQNELELDWDILSIRKDAIFVINRTIKKERIGKHIVFRPKGKYSHHMYINPYDIYINSDTIDIKGINDEKIILHENGILSLIRMICKCQGEPNPKKSLNDLFSDFVSSYKKRELDYDFYREFNPSSMYRVNLFGNDVLMENIDSDDLLSKTCIDYNYEKIILPMIRMLR